ncbi:MAG TPA: HAMP domain-containing protein, partial [Vicinamibacteria bacterium]|nr:HAMP domain-containing protein [Vicinamibacteria bacterium]
MRRDLSLKEKLIAGASACLLLAVAMWVVLFLSNGRVETRLQESIRDLDRVSGTRALISLTERLTGPVLNAADYGSDLAEKEGEFNTASAGAAAAMATLETLFTPEEAASSGYADVRDRLLDTRKDAARILEILKDPQARKNQTVDAEFDELRSSLSGKSSKVVADLRKMVESETRAAGEGLDDARVTSVRSGRVALFILILFAIVVPFVAYWVGKAISDPVTQVSRVHKAIVAGDFDQQVTVSEQGELGMLQESCRELLTYLRSLAEQADRLSDGDLTSLVKPRSERDRLGASWANMSAQLSRTIENARSASSSVSLAAQQLTASSNVLSNGTAQQAASVEETTASLEEMSSSITQNADHSRNLEQ